MLLFKHFSKQVLLLFSTHQEQHLKICFLICPAFFSSRQVLKNREMSRRLIADKRLFNVVCLFLGGKHGQDPAVIVQGLYIPFEKLTVKKINKTFYNASWRKCKEIITELFDSEVCLWNSEKKDVWWTQDMALEGAGWLAAKGPCRTGCPAQSAKVQGLVFSWQCVLEQTNSGSYFTLTKFTKGWYTRQTSNLLIYTIRNRVTRNILLQMHSIFKAS